MTDEPADVVLDCFGLMHAADQAAALAERAARVAAGGVLLLQYHSLDTIVRLRAVERAAARALRLLLDHRAGRHAGRTGFSPRTAWQFELYGGTVLLAASRDADARDSCQPAGRLGAVAARAGRQAGVRDPAVLARSAAQRARAMPADCATGSCRAVGRAHRARLRCRIAGGGPAAPGGRGPHAAAGGRRRLAGQAGPADAGDGHPCRRPGTSSAARRPAVVVLFLPDLLTEVRAAFPEVEAAGGRWVDADPLGDGTWPMARRPAAAQATGSSEACSSTRSLARHRARVGPMLPIGSPSWSEISA